MTEKLCRDCAHFRSVYQEEMAAWERRRNEFEGSRRRWLLYFPMPPRPQPPTCKKTDLVWGSGSPLTSSVCSLERSQGECGREGKFWEPKI